VCKSAAKTQNQQAQSSSLLSSSLVTNQIHPFIQQQMPAAQGKHDTNNRKLSEVFSFVAKKIILLAQQLHSAETS
jgi:hypothetical protein